MTIERILFMKLQITEETRLQARTDRTYIKPNMLIHAKYESTLIEEQVLAWAMSHTDDFVKSKENGTLTYTFPASVLREIMGAENSNSFYGKLKDTAQSMVGHTLGIEDPENDFFDYINVVSRATYDKGRFTIYFNPQIPLLQLKKNYTPLSLAMAMSFTSKYSMRLYENLKSRCYVPKGSRRKNDYFEIVISVAELKLLLGVVNAELPEVKKILRGSAHPDFELAVSKSPNQRHKRWADFKKWVIEKAVNEINEKKDLTRMHIEFKGRRGGRGAEIKDVEFYITMLEEQPETFGSNIPSDEAPEVPDEKKDMMVAQILLKLCEESVMATLDEARAIAKAGNYDMYEVEKAFITMKGSTTPVENKVRFIIAALKDNYQMSRKQINKYMEGRKTDSNANPYGITLLSEEPVSEDTDADIPLQISKEQGNMVYEQTELDFPFDFRRNDED